MQKLSRYFIIMSLGFEEVDIDSENPTLEVAHNVEQTCSYAHKASRFTQVCVFKPSYPNRGMDVS